jgi:hypothetical protein
MDFDQNQRSSFMLEPPKTLPGGKHGLITSHHRTSLLSRLAEVDMQIALLNLAE